MYLGPPEFLSVYHGSVFPSEDIKSNVEAHGMTLDIAPIETLLDRNGITGPRPIALRV